VNSRDAHAVDVVVRSIRDSRGTSIGVVADVTESAQVDELFRQTLEALGEVDILVNNAVTPVHMGEQGPFLGMALEGWDRFMRANLNALFYCTFKAAQIMCARRRGSVINISSNGSVRPHRQRIAYDSMKGAMDSFTRAVAVDLAPWGVRVNAILPGMIATDWWAALTDEDRERNRRAVPLGREGLPEDVAWAATFLAADDAAYVTGQSFLVDGGLFVQGRPPSAEIHAVVGPDSSPKSS
jgi:3-oxoacyl-[acyl-carrier protein] reductase